MSDFNWLDEAHEQELLRRQQRIASTIAEPPLPILDHDIEWLVHTLGKLLEERIATRNELTRLRAIEQEHLQGQGTLHLGMP